MFQIMGMYKGKTEVLDETNDHANAEYLVQEYRMAFGLGWLIWIKK